VKAAARRAADSRGWLTPCTHAVPPWTRPLRSRYKGLATLHRTSPTVHFQHHGFLQIFDNRLTTADFVWDMIKGTSDLSRESSSPPSSRGNGETGVPAAGGGLAGLFSWSGPLVPLCPPAEHCSFSSFGGQPRARPWAKPTGGCPSLSGFHLYFRSSKSPATKRAKTTEITPFMVKKAAFRRERSSALTRECS
jgi:hypothetical protein